MRVYKKTAAREVYYPESDGEPMAESDLHRDLMAELISELETFFQDDPEVYVSGNLLIYYVEGDPRKSFAPDVFVVRGVDKHKRRIYKLWEEGRAPDVVFEISSRTTVLKDTQRNFRLYERLGVREYFLYDPEYDWMPGGLAAWRREGDEFVEIEVVSGVARSEVLGLEVVDTGETLRLRDPKTGEFLPTKEEVVEARQEAEVAREQAEARAHSEAEAREQAEAELARLREELTRLRPQT
jgi:Uma2 family endonuclease